MENNDYKEEPNLNEEEISYSELDELLPFDDESEDDDKEENDSRENPFDNEDFLEGLEEDK